MSLDKKKGMGKKRISIVGTKTDFESLADVLAQAKRMFNIDIEMKVKDKDLPTRITLREEAEPDIISYPRTARALTLLNKALRKEIPASDDSQTIPADIGSMDWIYNDPRTAALAPESVRVLQSITEGVARPGLRSIPPARHYAARDIKQEFDSMFEGKLADNMKDKGGFFSTLEPEWVYIQTADVWPLGSEKWKKGGFENIQKLRELESDRLQDKSAYPPNLGMIVNSKGKKVKPTQAMVAVFRGDVEFDLKQKVNVNSKAWSAFVKGLPEGLLSKELTGSKPKTIEDLLKVFFSYNVGSFMKFDDATVRPIGPNMGSILTEHIYGDDRPQLPGQPPQRKLGDKILYSALVVATGKYRPGSHDVIHLKESEIPGWS
jgi:hypothetical protein